RQVLLGSERSMRRLLFAALVGVVGGCSLFGFDDFSGGKEPNAVTDGGSDGSTSGDATTKDGTTAGEGGGGASGAFCDRASAAAATAPHPVPGRSLVWPRADRLLSRRRRRRDHQPAGDRLERHGGPRRRKGGHDAGDQHLDAPATRRGSPANGSDLVHLRRQQ